MKFKAQAPNIPLSPEPTPTRWGTWISVSIYHCDNFQIVKKIVESFDEEETLSSGVPKIFLKFHRLKVIWFL